jgi:hypothetical protein
MLEIFLRLIFFIGAEESGEEGARGCRLITGTATPARENICRGGGRVGAAAAWDGASGAARAVGWVASHPTVGHGAVTWVSLLGT